MPSLDAERRTLQGRLANARRWNTPNADELARELAAVRIAAYVREVVDRAPPLTREQRDKIALLLRGGDAA